MTSATCSLQCPSRSPVRNAPRVRGNLENNYYEEEKKKKISSRVAAFLCWPYHLLRIQLREDGGDRRKKENREGGEKRECSRRLCLFSCSFSRCFVPPPVSNSCTGKTDFHIDSLLLFIDVNKMFTGDEIQRTGLNLVWQNTSILNFSYLNEYNDFFEIRIFLIFLIKQIFS